MAIESKIPEAELNIKDLNLEAPPATEVPVFDVEKAISKQEWEQITNYAAGVRDAGPDNLNFRNKAAWYGNILRNIKTVSEQELLDWQDRGYDWEVLSKPVDELNPVESSQYIANISQLYPEELELSLLLFQQGREIFESTCESLPLGEMSPAIMDTIMDLIRLSPFYGRSEVLISLVEDFEPSLEVKFNWLLNSALNDFVNSGSPARLESQGIDLVSMLYYLNNCRAFLGKDLIEPEGKLTKLLARFMERERPEQDSKVGWDVFIEYAAKIKTIQAKKIQFTTEGVNLIIREPKNLEPQNKSLPEIKKF